MLKNIFDRSNKVFIFATGSAALLLNLNPDIARRTICEKLFPLSFTEYLKLKSQKFEIKGLGQKIREALFSNETAEGSFKDLQALEQRVQQYYWGISKFDFPQYLNYGSLPFMITTRNESLVYNQIKQTLERVISSDIVRTGKFTSEIVAKIPALLYAVADMDAFNFSTLAKNLDISRPKVAEIFSLLEKTEVLLRVYPHGSHLNQVRKPAKYLFAAPAFRAMYYKMIGSTITPEQAQGKLREDLVAMYLHRILAKNVNSALTYDSAKGGADFILSLGSRKIVLEVGAGKKGSRQVVATAKKVKPAYSLIISANDLAYSAEFKAVKVPWELFLLS